MRNAFYILIFFLPTGIWAQLGGYTDPQASNFNASAQINDGSCLYPNTSIGATNSMNLPSYLSESSGLIFWNQELWTHNDSQDKNLYRFQPSAPNATQTVALDSLQNMDWEEISQDSLFIYIGDFGNNGNGNRRDLKIFRIDKQSLSNRPFLIDTIFFQYDLQVTFSPTGANNTDFDCEAMVVGRDSIYLFTKEWVRNETSIYALPKLPGNHLAQHRNSWNVQGLITGASYMEDEKLIVLSGYSSLLQPFIVLLYDFQANHFFSGNKRKINLNLSLHQIEGICTENGLDYYLSNERFVQSFITIPQKLHSLDLRPFLSNYLQPLTPYQTVQTEKQFLFPNPAENYIFLSGYEGPYKIINWEGKLVQEGNLKGGEYIDIRNFAEGKYIVQTFEQEQWHAIIWIKK